jgi:pyruvate,orthophosphate dikinase
MLNEIALSGSYPIDHVRQKLKQLLDENPSMGLRGIRLFTLYPELLMMQIRAIVEATLEHNLNNPSINVYPDISIPFVSTTHELEALLPVIKNEIMEVHGCNRMSHDHKSCLLFNIGVILSTPRACLRCSEIAPLISYTCFDTTNITELSYGISRIDSNKFIWKYQKDKVFNTNPFIRLDERGVGEQIMSSIKMSRETVDKNIRTFAIISDDHGNDLKSVEFFNNLDIDIISTMPKMIPLTKFLTAKSNIISLSSKYADMDWSVSYPYDNWTDSSIYW